MGCWRAGRQIGLRQADHVGFHPVGERFLRAAAARHGQHHGDNLVLGHLQVPPVEAEEDDHGQETDALVPVAVGMVGPEAVAVRRGEGCQIALGVIGLLVPGARERRLQRVLVTHAVKAAVLAQLLGVNRVDHEPVDPDRFRHRLLGKLAEGVSISLRGARRDPKGVLDRGIIRRQQDASLRLHREEPVTGPEVEMVRHVLRQRRRDRSPSLA